MHKPTNIVLFPSFIGTSLNILLGTVAHTTLNTLRREYHWTYSFFIGRDRATGVGFGGVKPYLETHDIPNIRESFIAIEKPQVIVRQEFLKQRRIASNVLACYYWWVLTLSTLTADMHIEERVDQGHSMTSPCVPTISR